MRYKLLGNSGLRVSELCLGAMTFGSPEAWCANYTESKRMMQAYTEAGGNFIDTADLYTLGESEKVVGEFVNEVGRDQFVVATKYTHSMPDPANANAAGNHRKNFMQSLDASLKRLNTDYIDLYWLHTWDYTTPVEEVMRAFDDAVSAGKILYFGFSDTPAWVTARANTQAELRGRAQVAALQLEYSLVERSIERELLPMSRAMDMAILSWSPLASGVLSGKYTRQSNGGEGKRLDTLSLRQLDERVLGIAHKVDSIADQMGVSSAQVALAWVRQRGTIPIIGVRTMEQLQDNMASLNVQLNEEQLLALEEASAFALGHPYDMPHKPHIRALFSAGHDEAIDNHHSPFV